MRLILLLALLLTQCSVDPYTLPVTDSPATEPTVETNPPGGTEPLLPHPGHSSMGQAFDEGPRQGAVLMDNTGNVSFPIQTESPEAQAFFNQGIGQLHGFWAFEAERSFRQVAALDPTCPMAYWGMAMANTIFGAGSAKRAQDFIAEAEKRVRYGSDSDRLWIEATAQLYRAGIPVKSEQRIKLVALVASIVSLYPNELEPKAFLALFLWENSGSYGIPIESDRINQLLDTVFAASPMHPAHHYRIHLWNDSLGQPLKALYSAAVCGATGSNIAHLWHMPGHVYWRLHRFHDSAWQQEASARVDHKHMSRFWINPYDIHDYAHNNSWLLASWNHIGRVSDSISLAENLIQLPRHPEKNPASRTGSLGLLSLIQVLENNSLWDLAIQKENSNLFETVDPYLKLRKERLLATSHFALNHSAQAKTHVEELIRQQEFLAASIDPATTDITSLVILGSGLQAKAYLALLDGNRSLADSFILQLSDIDERAQRARWDFFPESFYLAELHLLLEQKEQALKVIVRERNTNSNAVQPLARHIQFLVKANKLAEAKEVFEKDLRPLSEAIELNSPLFNSISTLKSVLPMPEDWRLPRIIPEDFGPRPTLDSLGPNMLWTRRSALPFALPDGKKESQSLDKYLQNGRRLLLLFYLGQACPGCVNQLRTLNEEGWFEKFRDQKIDIVAIGPDSIEKLEPWLEVYQFPILSNPDFSVFKQYGTYDDFEKFELHGLYLINDKRQIEWFEISASPFMQFEFLLKESERLSGR